jgi:hypothetical protein
MLNTVLSKRGVSIRLTDERWSHVVEEHCELAGMLHEILDAVALPDRILAGYAGECLAVKAKSTGKALVVVYREDATEQDGFVITAFVTSRVRSLERRPQLWP